MHFKNIAFGLMAMAFAFYSCSDSSDDSVEPVETWPTYNETYKDNRLNLTLNDEAVEGVRVNLQGVAEEEIIVSPKNVIYGLADVGIPASAVESTDGWTIEGEQITDQYSLQVSGKLKNTYILDLDLTYEITDLIVGEWTIPTGLRGNAVEFVIESDLTEFEFLGETIQKSTLETTVNLTLETLVKRYVKSLTFEDDGTWNVVYYDKEELEGSLPEDLVEYYVDDDTVSLGVDLNKYDALDPQIRRVLDTALDLILRGLPMTRTVDDSSLSINLEKETLEVVFNTIESVIETNLADGKEINELLYNTVTDLNIILANSTEFDIAILMDRSTVE